MSALEIALYTILGLVVLLLLFKWFIYDPKIKPKKADRKKIKKQESEDLEHEDKE